MSIFTPPQVLTTPGLRLEPLGPEHLEGTWTALQNPGSMRLTGTHGKFTRPQGFQVEGRLRDALHWDGEWIDAIVMGMLPSDRR